MVRKNRVRGWLTLSALTGCAIASNVTGCGGSGTTATSLTEDAGADSPSEGGGSSSGDATASSSGGEDASSSGGDGGEDATGSSSGGEAGEDSSSSSGGEAGADSSSSSGGEAGADGSSSSGGEAGADGSSGGSSEAGADAGDGSAPCVSGNACALGNGSNGICVSGTCSQCDSGGSSTGPDSACSTAYSGTYVCASGVCVQGNCSGPSDTYCATLSGTPTCGFSIPNTCGGCTSDGQCASGHICVVDAFDAGEQLGACVSANQGGCGASSSNTTCPANPADECCAGSCYAGNCCIISSSPTGCAGLSGTTCAANSPSEVVGGGVCTACAAVTGNPYYYVDPEHGNDQAGTGSNSAVGCAFRTITRALQFIGGSPITGTQIIILGGTVDAGAPVTIPSPSQDGGASAERFPITLGTNIELTSKGGPVRIEVPAASEGFILSGASSMITSGSGSLITIDGQQNTANAGIVATSASATIAGITVQDFENEAVLVATTGAAGASLTIGANTSLSNNAGDGLLVQSGTATATGVTGEPILFNNNGTHGVRVTATGIVSLTGQLGATPPTTATIVMQGNTTAGVWVENTTATTQSTLTGIASVAGAANGIRIIPGSNVKLRGSWVLGNAGNGVLVSNNAGTTTTVTNINLGNGVAGGDAGGNTLQAVTGGNGGAGICLDLPATATGISLNALGNTFGGVNCETTATTLTSGALTGVTGTGRACGGGVDIGGTPLAATSSILVTANKINVSMCTYN
jgi:hypothetical protein